MHNSNQFDCLTFLFVFLKELEITKTFICFSATKFMLFFMSIWLARRIYQWYVEKTRILTRLDIFHRHMIDFKHEKRIVERFHFLLLWNEHVASYPSTIDWCSYHWFLFDRIVCKLYYGTAASINDLLVYPGPLKSYKWSVRICESEELWVKFRKLIFTLNFNILSLHF